MSDTDRDTKPSNFDAGLPAPDAPISAAEICKLRTWCSRFEHDESTPCLEAPRRRMEPTEFGPARAKQIGWGR